jgi:hypothetical protein
VELSGEGLPELFVAVREVDDVWSIAGGLARRNELDVALFSFAAKLFEALRRRPNLAPLLGQGRHPIGCDQRSLVTLTPQLELAAAPDAIAKIHPTSGWLERPARLTWG